MDFTFQPPPLCPPRRAGGARTPPARPLRVTLNPACVSRPAAASAPSTSPGAAARTPPARALRVSLNPACISRPSAVAAAAAKKPKRPVSCCDEEDPPTKGSGGAGDGKENKIAPPAAAPKFRTVLRPCSRVDEAPRLPPGSTTTRLRATAADGTSGAGAGAATAPAPKRKATPADTELALLRPCSRDDAASRSPLGSTSRPHVGVAADGRVAPASAAKRKATPSDSEQAQRRASPAAASASAASASPSPGSSEAGGTVRALLATAGTATDAIRRREIERLRAQARRELDQVVRTVEFNDPFISPQDVLR